MKRYRRNPAQRQELRQHLGVKRVGLLGGLSNDAQLAGMSQQPIRRERFEKLNEPFVARRRFDNELKRAKRRREPGGDAMHRQAQELLAFENPSIFCS